MRNSGVREGLASPPAKRLDGLALLVVDDEEDNLEVVSLALADEGATVRAASSGQEALAILATWRPHILVSDIVMGDSDGCALLQKIRALPTGRQIPAIAMTAQSGDAYRRQSLLAGFQVHLGKPFHIDMLVELIVGLADRYKLK